MIRRGRNLNRADRIAPQIRQRAFRSAPRIFCKAQVRSDRRGECQDRGEAPTLRTERRLSVLKALLCSSHTTSLERLVEDGKESACFKRLHFIVGRCVCLERDICHCHNRIFGQGGHGAGLNARSGTAIETHRRLLTAVIWMVIQFD